MSDGCCKLCRCNWLEHILHTPQLHRFLRHGKGFVAGQDHGLGIGAGGLHPFQQLNAGHPGHFQITDQNLYRFLAKDPLRFHAVCGIQHPVYIKIFPVDRAPDGLDRKRLIIHNQNGRHGVSSFSGCSVP